MQFFTHDDLRIAYLDEGPRDGFPILLVHGFASSAQVNWIEPGWIDVLTGAGHRVVALDHRGHGQSDKPHDSALYTPGQMAGDCIALLDHLSIEQAVFFGYSMGARVSVFAAIDHAPRVRALILGGLGWGLVEGVGDWGPIAEALLAPSLDVVTHARGRMFRAFADRTRSDRFALAACIEANRQEPSQATVAALEVPALIGVGTRDDIAGSAERLAALMPQAEAFAIEGRDHMLAVGDRSFKAAVVSFLHAHGFTRTA
ncbi:alpha/beta fold hydrolase [Aureimonas frigidaquae]|uniref:Hydrolase n=1 Tax=Aureimonas frigidaquae TaxID=424757 RepID=A0A0P0Z238_9HYPH|nr:alpha/beta hydrolase [Aureimonas frigidaquae]BAT28131.1 hydrolase [Aureimonas frigidaquae]